MTTITTMTHITARKEIDMYTILMVTTTTIIATAMLVITFIHKANEKQITKDDTLSEEDREQKSTKNEQRTYRMFTVCTVLAGIFMTSADGGDMRELSLSSNQPWHTIYENDISARVTIKQESSTWKTNEIDVTKPVKQTDIETFFQPFLFFDIATTTLKITASNNRDTTAREAEMPKENLIEKWPKGTKPDKKTGRIVKVEYRKIERPLKWFGIVVDKESIPEARVTIEYDALQEPKEPSTKTLFGEN